MKKYTVSTSWSAYLLWLLGFTFFIGMQRAERVHAQESKKNMQQSQVYSQQEADSVFAKAIQKKSLGEFDEAIELFQLFSKMRPESGTAHYEIAKIFYLENNNVEKAVKEAALANKLEPNNKWIKEFYADMLAISQQKDEASAIYKDLSEKEKITQDYIIKELVLLIDDNKYQEALDLVNGKMKQNGDFTEEQILLIRYDILTKLKRYDEAIKDAQALVKIDNTQARYQIMLANAFENNKDEPNAEKILTSINEKYLDDKDAQYALLEYYLSKNQMDRATIIFEQALKNKSFDAEERNTFLRLFSISTIVDTNNVKYMTSALDKAVAQMPIDTSLIFIYAEYLSVLGKYDAGAQLYKKVLSSDSVSIPAYNGLLILYLQNGNTDSLIKYGEMASTSFPNDANFTYLTALGHVFKKEYKQAASLTESAIQFRNPDQDYFFQLDQMCSTLGDAYYFEKKYKQSDSAFDYSLDLNPDNASTLNNYAYYLSERNERLDAAAQMSLKSLKLQPNEPTFLDTYGWIMYKKGDYKQAKKYVQSAIDQLTPDKMDAALYEHMGDIELKLGKRKRALAWWEKAKNKEGASDELEAKIIEHK